MKTSTIILGSSALSLLLFWWLRKSGGAAAPTAGAGVALGNLGSVDTSGGATGSGVLHFDLVKYDPPPNDNQVPGKFTGGGGGSSGGAGAGGDY